MYNKKMIQQYDDTMHEALKALYLHREWYGGVFDEARDGQERLAQKIADDPQAILVYERDGELLGTISIIEDGRVAWLYRFVVKGFDSEITKELYDAAAKILKERGHSEVLVYMPVNDKNLDARYNSLGMAKGGDYTCFYKEL